jgi:hypothetical protein
MNPIIVTATRDVTEQRLAEVELEKKQKTLAETLEKTQSLSTLCEHAGVPMVTAPIIFLMLFRVYLISLRRMEIPISDSCTSTQKCTIDLPI